MSYGPRLTAGESFDQSRVDRRSRFQFHGGVDRITRSLMEEFNASAALGNLAEDKLFEHFATHVLISRHYYGETFETTDHVTGSGGDTGIDSIAVLVNGVLVSDPDMVEELAETNGYLDVTFIFIQAERTSGFDTAKIGQFGFGVADFFKDAPSLPRNTAVNEAADVMNRVYRLSSKFKRGKPASKLYYVTTGKWTGDANLEARRKAVSEDLVALNIFRDVEFAPIDADHLQKLYNQTKNAISREFTFASKIVIPEIPGVKEAYLGILPAKDFVTLLQDDGGELIRSLFYDNVRDWQDYNAVNTEMRNTILSAGSRSRFVLMNNGVTVIAKTVQATGNKVYIEDYQIVNGCQTSNVLYDQQEHLENVMVPLRLIAATDEDVTASIVKATNRQTEVKAEQLLALSDFQKKLELFFAAYPESERLLYERRSRQFSHGTAIEKTRIVTPGNLIRAFASIFLEEPHRTTRTYRALLENVGKGIFGPDHKLEPYYLAAVALYRLEYLFRSQAIDAKLKPARYHVLFAARLLATLETPPRPNSHEMARYSDALTKTLWDPVKGPGLLKKAAALVDTAAAGNFHRDQIRTQPFTEKLKKLCVDSR